jgi:chromosome segregation ATPase
MKSRVSKERHKDRPPSQTTAATPLAGQVLAGLATQGDEALLTKQRAASAAQPATTVVAQPMVSPRPAKTSTATISMPGSEVLTQGRARIGEFRERLHASSQASCAQTGSEPWATAEATRQAVDSFRARVSAVSRERDALTEALQLVRAELDQTKQELAAKNQALVAAEVLASERIQLANTLLGEVEVLADERDQALVRISELKGLDEQQMRLLSEAEAAITQRDEQLVSMQKTEAELHAAVRARTDDIERLTARLAERTAERDLLMDRIMHLEAEVRALNDSRGALVEIRRLLDSAKV